MSEKIAFTVVKDEAPFLLEWVAYCRVVGFDSVVIYSNDCTDETDRLCQALAAEGLVEHHVHSPEGASPQGHAAWQFCRSGRAKAGDWILFCDPDEFLNIKFGAHRLDDLLARLEGKQGILLPWRLFGSAGRLHFSGRSVDPAYCCAAADGNINRMVIKTLFRQGPEIDFMGVHGPKMKAEYWQDGSPFVTSRFEDIDTMLPAYVRWRESGQIVTCEGRDSSYGLVQLNHYFTRSPACFALKRRRGPGGKAAAFVDRSKAVFRQNDYDNCDFNDSEDASILVLKDDLDAAIKSMMAVPAIRAIQDEIRGNFLLYEAEFLLYHFGNDA